LDDTIHDKIHACTQKLLLFREILRGIHNGWANIVDIASIQGLNFLTVQPGSIAAGLQCERFFKTLSPKPTFKSMLLNTYWTSVCVLLSAAQKSSMQVLESSNDPAHADGNIERGSIDASEEANGDISNVIGLNAPRSPHGEAQVVVHSQVASEGTGAVNIHNIMWIWRCIEYAHLHLQAERLATRLSKQVT
jgi:hypothetical protein